MTRKLNTTLLLVGLSLMLLISLSGCNVIKQRKPKISDSNVRLLTVSQFAQSIDNQKADVLLIDVRLETKAFQKGHIDGARHVPADTIKPYYPFPSNTDWVCIYDADGLGMAVVAAKRLLAGKPRYEIVVLEGGMQAWEEALQGEDDSGQSVKKVESTQAE